MIVRARSSATRRGKDSCVPEGDTEEGAGQRLEPPGPSLPAQGRGGVGVGGHDTQRAVQTFGGHSVRRHPHAAAGRRGSQTTRTLPSVT